MKRFVFDLKDHESIGVTEINRFSVYYRSLVSAKAEVPALIEIQFGDNIYAIDELFYAYLLLFSRSFPEVKIELKFVAYSNVFGIASQQVGYLNKLYGVTIKIRRNHWPEEADPRASSEYFPPLLVTGKSHSQHHLYPDFFMPQDVDAWLIDFFCNLSPEQIQLLKGTFKSKDDFYDTLKKLVAEFSFKSLFLQYLFAVLQELDVLRYSTTELLWVGNANFTFRIQHLSNENTQHFAGEVVRALRAHGFFTYSYAELFLYRILISNGFESDMAKVTRSSGESKTFREGVSEFAHHISGQVDYIKELYTGLIELQKNIGEHSGLAKDTGVGVISARILRNAKVQVLKHSGKLFDTWFDRFEIQGNDKTFFLDLNVIDSGNINITAKYINNLREEIDSLKSYDDPFIDTIRLDFERDIGTMTDPLNPYRISDFLNFQNISLFHQVKRVNSRLGLLIFSHLILKEKKGFIKVSSNSLLDAAHCESTMIYLNAGGDTAEFETESSLGLDASGNFSAIGTCYHFIVPLKTTYYERRPMLARAESAPTGTSSSVFKKLHEFRLDDPVAADADTFVNIISEFDEPHLTGKYDKIYEYRDLIVRRLANIEKKIALISYDDAKPFLLNSSDWMRFLASMQMVDAGLNLIIIGMPRELHAEIISINRFFDSANSGFWNTRYAVLFFIKITHKYANKNEVGLWFNNLLIGGSFSEYEVINRGISRYHDNLYRISPHTPIIVEKQPMKPEGIFFADGKLLNFELILRTAEKVTLFEDSLRSLLELEIQDEEMPPPDIKDYSKIAFFLSLKGYKISRSHFKLGSKIHITDFYYAKRLFYNSFYANRFAFLIADHIYWNILKKQGCTVKTKITLVGYSNYSELLVSNIRRLLNEWGYLEIRHDVVLENERVLKNAGNIQENVLVVVPISSSFSTSKKIKHILLGLNEHMKMPYQDVNAIVIGNRNFRDPEKRFANENQNTLYRNFGWQLSGGDKDDPNLIAVKHDDKVRPQKFFIGLETDWHAIYNCPSCYNDESCLLETEKNNVTPDLIFGLPIAPKIKKERNFYELFKDKESKFLISDHHITKGRNHFYFYIRTGAFMADPDRKNLVVNWLNEDLKGNKFFSSKFLDGIKIIIVTPSLTANSGFVNLVNQVLFQDTATVLQFSTAEDCLQNFVKFNGPLLHDTKIIYIDDAINSGRSFHMINNYVRNIPAVALPELAPEDIASNIGQSQRSIDLCITLFEATSYFDAQTIRQNLDHEFNVQSFARMHIPPFGNEAGQFPYTIQMEIYRKLAEKSTLDMMQIHFLEQQRKFKPLAIDVETEPPRGDLHALLHFLLYHELFNIFTGYYQDNFEFKYDQEIVDILKSERPHLDILKSLVKRISSTVSVTDFLRQHPTYELELELLVIRIFAEQPFVQHKRIKELVFSWISIHLSSVVKEIINFGEDKLPDIFFHNIEVRQGKKMAREFSRYNTLKLLMRLAVKLKINMLFSSDVLTAMRVLLVHLNDRIVYKLRYTVAIPQGELLPDVYRPILVEKTNPDDSVDRIFAIGLTTYYVALVQELIIEDEAKAIKLVKNIVEIIRGTKFTAGNKTLTLRNDFRHPFIQLLRLLVLENTFIFDTFFTNFQKENSSPKDLSLANPQVVRDQYERFQNNYLEPYIDRYRFDALELMLCQYNYTFNELALDADVPEPLVDAELRDAFKKTMYLKVLLKNELTKDSQPKASGSKPVDLKNKIENMLALLCEILAINKNPERGGGAYLTIRYKEFDKPTSEIVSDDLYTVANYATRLKYKLHRDLAGPRSINLQFFRGLTDKDGRKPKTTFEVLYDLDNKWDARELDFVGDFIAEGMELQGSIKYRNLFFLRITDILEIQNPKQKPTFQCDPKAVICFYRNLVTDEAPASRIARLDPKRVRLLLLLRDDLNLFIKHHLSNDSFMAYVEQKEKENYVFTLKHGIKTYRKAITRPLTGLKLDATEDEFTKNKSELKEGLAYLINKINLMSLASKSLVNNEPMPRKEHRLADIAEQFEKRYSYILNFHHGRLASLNPGEKIAFLNEIPLEEREKIVFLPLNFLAEMIFELIFNIRKHILDEHRILINQQKPLIIRLRTEMIGSTLYLVTENNHNYLVPEAFVRKNQVFSETYDNHGLNLLANILRDQYGKLIFARTSDHFIAMKIPLRIKKINDIK